MNYVINGVLAVAVIILFVLQFSGRREAGVAKTTFTSEEDSIGFLPVAYVNMDSLLLNYNYYKDLSEIILRKQENSLAVINQKTSDLQKDAQEFERKYNNNAFLTRQRAEEEQRRIMTKQQELEDLRNRLSQELMSEEQRMTEQLRDSLVAQLKVYNQNKKYQMIFSNTATDNILLANDAYNITEEILIYLNKNYSPSGK
ncbi:MAG: OmpH family outer membrane protein [Tannerellaceae bacterium]|jgi:outer membrane protein|nr:OmpH family outer membrane protein [Tannerellaceae bacterium]